MKEAYTAKEIGQALGIKRQAVVKRANEEQWPYKEENGRGGKKKLFLLASLPTEVRRAIEVRERGQEAEALRRLQEEEVAARLQEAPKVLQLPERERRVALARMAVLGAAERFCLSRPGEKTEKVQEFYGRLNAVLQAHNPPGRRSKEQIPLDPHLPSGSQVQLGNQMVNGIRPDACATKSPPAPLFQRGEIIPTLSSEALREIEDLGFEGQEISEVLGTIKKVSWQTAYRWEGRVEAQPGVAALARGYHRNAQGIYETPGYGVKCISPDMAAYMRALFTSGQVKLWPRSHRPEACATNDRPRIECNMALVYKRLEAEFAKHTKLPHYGHFTKWLNRYLYQEQEGLCAVCLPSYWRATFQPKGGLASEQAEYFGERWEIDATPADVMLADGRHEILAVVDIYSRDALIEVEKHATSMTVAKLLRQGMLAWGVPAWLIGDRGLIFRSQHIQTACAQLGIAQRDCDAYAPWQKPHVETFFGSLARMLFEALPWFIGHNPVQRRRIEEFSRFHEVFYHRKNPIKISCEATAAQLREVLHHWLEKVYRAETHRFKDVKALGRSGLVWERQANSPKRVPQVKNPEYLDDLLSPAFERVYSSGVQWGGMPLAYQPDSSEGWERAQKHQGQKVIFKPSLADVAGGAIWACREDGRPGEFICRLRAEIRGGQSLEEYQKGKKRILKAHKGNRRLAEAICAPPGYDRQLAAMPKPKVAVGGFGAPEYDGGAYREMKDYDDRQGLRLTRSTGETPAPPDACATMIEKAAALGDLQREREADLEALKQSEDVQRYVGLIYTLARKEEASSEDRQFIRYFVVGDDYRRLEEWFREVKMRAAQEATKNKD